MASSEEIALRRPLQPIAAAPRASDARLIRRARRGSADAVEQLIRRHWPKAHRAALLIVHDQAGAEDIAQEAMLAAVRSLDRFDWRRPIGPWLHRIVVNRSLDHLRARARRAERELDPGTSDADAPLAIAGDERSAEIVAALSHLDATDRAIVVMRHVLDYRSSEIAKLLAIPSATVRSRLRRSLAAVRSEVGASHTQEPSRAGRPS